jgi:hypothetical protein
MTALHIRFTHAFGLDIPIALGTIAMAPMALASGGAVAAALAANDFSRAHATVGEAVGLMSDAPGAQELILRMTRDARSFLLKVSASLPS